MFLRRIIEEKHTILQEKKRKFPLSEIVKHVEKSKKRNFYSLFSQRFPKQTKIIAEVKRASPSKGSLLENLNLPDLIKEYEKGGADALSIITEEKYFKGSISFLKEARRLSYLPLLRKDFILDEYEIFESKAYGADCVLLIGEALEKEKLCDLLDTCMETDLDCLLEVHKIETLEKVFSLDRMCFLLGLNTRDLETLKIDFSSVENVLKYVPNDMPVIVESGIEKRDDIERFKKFGVSGFLIGTSIVSSSSPREKLKELKG